MSPRARAFYAMLNALRTYNTDPSLTNHRTLLDAKRLYDSFPRPASSSETVIDPLRRPGPRRRVTRD